MLKSINILGLTRLHKLKQPGTSTHKLHAEAGQNEFSKKWFDLNNHNKLEKYILL